MMNIGQGIEIGGDIIITYEFASAPVNLIPPSINGPIVTGSTVTINNGVWSAVPIDLTYTYQWQLDSSNVSGATSNSFFLTDAMANSTISATVFATNVIGTGSANTPDYYVNDWGPGDWTVSNTGISIGTSVFDTADDYIYRMTSSTILSRTQDGSSWANVSIPITAPSHLLQAGERLIIWKSGTNNAAYSNSDGASWTYSNINVNTTTNLGSGATDGANIIIIRGDPASNSFVRSTNFGTTWANVDTGSATNFTTDIAYGNGIFITVGNVAAAAKLSSDGGNSWSSLGYTMTATSIAFGDGKFVAVYPYGADSNPSKSYVTSDNGNTWTATRLPDQTWKSVVFADTHFVASEINGNVIYSIDGINWSTPYRTIPLIEAGSGSMSYLPSHSLLLNGGGGYYVTHTQVPGTPVDPTAPSTVNAVPTNSSSATVTWSTPASPGGSPIINYKVEAIGTDGAPTVTQYTVGTETTKVVTGLVTGKSYYFNVYAINSEGEGPDTPSEQIIQIIPAILENWSGGLVISANKFSATVVSSTSGQSLGTYSAAFTFCNTLTLGGYSDWMMPGVSSMQAISSNITTITGTYGWYWTVDAYNPALPNYNWIVNVPSGTTNWGDRTSSGYYVRAVRVQFY